jgi:hypothetical protein
MAEADYIHIGTHDWDDATSIEIDGMNSSDYELYYVTIAGLGADSGTSGYLELQEIGLLYAFDSGVQTDNYVQGGLDLDSSVIHTATSKYDASSTALGGDISANQTSFVEIWVSNVYSGFRNNNITVRGSGQRTVSGTTSSHSHYGHAHQVTDDNYKGIKLTASANFSATINVWGVE